MSFHAIPLPPTSRKTPKEKPSNALSLVFGYESFRSPQREIVDAVLSGRDVLAVMPTGGGKSLCFQIPALCLAGTTIVVSPLLALMRDQTDRLRRLGVRAAALVSAQAMERTERGEIERAFASGSLDLLYVSPEKLASPSFARLAAGVCVPLVAVDEAHCVLAWGRDFRPDYLSIGTTVAALFPSAARIALTATAGAPERKEIADRLLRPPCALFVAGFDRPNISLSVSETRDPAPEAIRRAMEDSARGGVVIYCRTRAETESIAAALAAAGASASAYHAGLADADRARIQDSFLNGALSVVSATSAFGMGVDKPDVASVIHCGLPSSIEAYYQESGRAGRDGRPASARLFWAARDVGRRTAAFAAAFEEGGDQAAGLREKARLEQVLGYVAAPVCREGALIRRFGETQRAPCGRCDTCRSPANDRDATADVAAAVGMLSEIGDAHIGALAESLAGIESDRTRNIGAASLRGFGAMRALGLAGAKRLLRQCVGAGFISVDNATARLAPTPQGLAVANGTDRALFRLPGTPRARPPSGLPEWRVELWDALMQARKARSEESGLAERAIARTEDITRLVSGASPATLSARCDAEFLAAVAAILERKRPPNKSAAFDTGLF